MVLSVSWQTTNSPAMVDVSIKKLFFSHLYLQMLYNTYNRINLISFLGKVTDFKG